MIIDMRILAEGHSTLTGTTDLESVKADLPVIVDKISYIATIDRNGPTAFVHVTFKGALELECSRCLSSFPLTINGDFRIIIKEKSGNSSIETIDDEVDFYYDSHHDVVDISPAFFDEIMISVPLMPLCSESCKGIEVHGLKNISVVQDGTVRTENSIDPRWEALKKLKMSS